MAFDYERPSVAVLKAHFAEMGLTGEFWKLDDLRRARGRLEMRAVRTVAHHDQKNVAPRML